MKSGVSRNSLKFKKVEILKSTGNTKMIFLLKFGNSGENWR